MSVISVPQAFNEEELYVDLQPIFGHSLFLKCEGFNFAGSIKLKAAAEMVDAADRDGMLTPGSILVESSSGNLGVRRLLPGLGSGVRPPLLDESLIDEVVRVDEADSIRACHRLARRGFLFGGSTGTVVSGAMSWLARHGYQPTQCRPVHRGRHRPRPGRALSRHHLPDQLDRGHLRQGRAPGRRRPGPRYRQTAS